MDELKATLERIVLKPGPRYGQTLTIGSDFIQRVIHKHRVVQRNALEVQGASHVAIQLAAQTIAKQVYLDEAEQYLYQHLAQRHTNIQLTQVGVYKSLGVPQGEDITRRYQIAHGTPVSSRMKVMLHVYQAEQLYSKQPIWFSVKGKAFGFKVVHSVLENTPLSEAMLKPALVDIADLQQQVITDKSDIVNKRVKQALAAGDILTIGHLHTTTHVVPGQQVDVYVSHAGITLYTRAIALQGGDKGQTINLRNIKSKQVFQGVVMDMNLVKSI